MLTKVFCCICNVRTCRYNSTSRGWASPSGWDVSGNVVLNCSKRVCLAAAYWLYPNITNHDANSAMCDEELANWTKISKEPFMNGLETIIDATWCGNVFFAPLYTEKRIL
jgi:hypothetical protein